MKLGRFLTTLGIGALAGMLLAPKKGSELREDYQKLISETIDSIKKTVDEFDVDDFKDSSLAKLNELKDKFDDVVTKLQDSDQYSKLKDQVDNVIVQVNDKINEVKEKMSEQEFDDFSDLEDEINDIEDDLNVIIDDLKD